MDDFSKYFDEYSFNSRVKPAFFLVFPIFISLLVLFEPSRTWTGSTVTFLVAFGVINFAANQMSAKGNVLQDKLFKKWGGAPTTIVLRHSDNTIDSVTKSRYMDRLALLISNFTHTTPEYEQANPEGADELYMSASNYLREHTRDTTAYPLVFKENIAYGFSRNIRAFKTLGIFITVSSLLVSLVVTYLDATALGSKPPKLVIQEISFPYLGLIAILLSMLWAWVFLVTENWVKVRAFAYAKRLYSACEKITVD
ncbi:hypothetical protein IG389_00595 [Idiomarina abyssalis]|uniref:Uncharacterized protein n=1 Tax=Idiomarina abyssalis TaxID=86102 RepID=A0A8I1KH35_9GAMM|nr:hypothetical protein [Idiomarina abyssalis]MBJ7267654.1 hypothetical protein [Idiomarina abyssalis]MBJ7272415.1 hypothetical protein [Idiomarina abyssalis]MBJ7315345.1 hypothetical protein [Idiomarina abyssalis]